MERLLNFIENVETDKKVVLTIEQPCFLTNIVSYSDEDTYGKFLIPESSSDVNLWLNKLDSTSLSHHYIKVKSLVYDNGIRSVDERGNTTELEDLSDTLYIMIDSKSDEEEFVDKYAVRLTDNISVVGMYVYSDEKMSKLLYSKVLGYTFSNVRESIALYSDDLKFISNLLYFDVM